MKIINVAIYLDHYAITSSQAISPVRCIKETDVSMTITSLMMKTEIVLEALVYFIHLTRLIVQESLSNTVGAKASDHLDHYVSILLLLYVKL
jgi:hypothetical protein